MLSVTKLLRHHLTLSICSGTLQLFIALNLNYKPESLKVTKKPPDNIRTSIFLIKELN